MTVCSTTVQSYGTHPRSGRPPLSDASVISLTISLTLGTWMARPVTPTVAVVLVVAAGLTWRSSVRTAGTSVRPRTFDVDWPRALRVSSALLAMALLGSWSGDRAWRAATAGPTAPQAVHAPAALVTDPVPIGSGRSVVVQIDGRRFEALAYGSPGRRLARLLAGDIVIVEGRVRPAPAHRARRLAIRHVVGVLDLERIQSAGEGAPLSRAANRVRRALESGTSDLPAVERSLFLGLVIGDDRDQPRSMVEEFRRSGLSHLTAVSGQNVSFVLLLAGPFVTRLRPAARWLVTIGLIGWFAALTRFEPSVLRAAGMATLSATAFWRGRQVGPIRALSITVAGFELVDPLLVWSVGWWLSVGATAGIALLAAPIEARLPGPRSLRIAASVTLAANLGVLPISVLVFDRSPLVSLAANLLAVPVAGLVMVVGIPTGLLAAALPELAPVLLVPGRLGTRWVLLVARLAATVEPDGWGRLPALIQLVTVGAVLARRRQREADASPRGDDG